MSPGASASASGTRYEYGLIKRDRDQDIDDASGSCADFPPIPGGFRKGKERRVSVIYVFPGRGAAWSKRSGALQNRDRNEC